MLAFSVTFTSACRPKTLSHITKILMQVVNVLFQICDADWANIIKMLKICQCEIVFSASKSEVRTVREKSIWNQNVNYQTF